MVLINKKEKDWHVLEFFMPIKESATVGKDFFIRGMAINETTTRNGVKYIATELERAAPSFRNKPILLDHKNEVMSTVGRTTENVNFSHDKKGIEFEAKIMDKQIQSMINDGRITDVSIGAKVQDLVQNKDDESVTAVGMEGLEISLVAVPGDPGANIATAIQNCFEIKEKLKVDTIKNDERGDVNMTEKTPEKEVVAVKEEAKTEVKEEVAKEEVHKTQVNVDMSGINEMTKELHAMRTEIAEMKKIKEEEVIVAPMEKPKEEPKDETVGVVGGEVAPAEEATEGFIIEKSDEGRGFQISMDYNKAGETKLKRLVV